MCVLLYKNKKYEAVMNLWGREVVSRKGEWGERRQNDVNILVIYEIIRKFNYLK